MAVTRSRAAGRAAMPSRRQAVSGAAGALVMLALAAVVSGTGLWLVYRAKSAGFAETGRRLGAHEILNLNDLSAREDLLPLLGMFPDAPERQFVARHLYDASGGLRNVGALARVRVPESAIRRTRGLTTLTARLDRMAPAKEGERMLPLLSGDQFRQLKPRLVVRRPESFRREFVLWVAVFFAAFFAVEAWWWARAFTGDRTLLAPILLLCGVGFILMVSLRDPVRDSMIFADFAQGAAGGCALMAVLSFVDFERVFGKLSFVPLAGSLVLSALLMVFGYGPGTSDAKVNLFGFQPVELIRILLVLFLAGYFARRWDVLRHARETRPAMAWLARRISIPPVDYTLPVFVCVALALVFFFLQKDLGPALVFASLFLVLYGIARASAVMPVVGLAVLLAGFVTGYALGVPHTVGERVSMWLSPWDNLVHGGDQLAHSLWAFATGATFGTGLGLGDAAVVPAVHTDLVLAALGEEWGFCGVLAVAALYGIVLYRSFRIALRASGDYQFFLAAGMASAVALQVLLIAGGSLGVLPLSGVVTPFLSYGRSAMLANFAAFAVVLSISRAPGQEERNAPFRGPVRACAVALGALACIIVAKAVYVQVLHADAVMGHGTLVVQADGARRYQYNPRFTEVMREIPKGVIYDRNGLPLAASRWEELEPHRAEYARLGIDIDRACPRAESRHYPFGGLTFDLLGDVRTRARWAAPNTSFVERDAARRLRGYDDRPTLVEVRNPRTGAMEPVVRYDYRELVPLLRHRYEPEHPAVRRILDRPRDVRMSIDARLQVRAAKILAEQVRAAGQQKGALVVLDPANGDLLASVGYPVPSAETPDIDRARYGLYPPGSTFKVVTAMAALRKNPALANRKYSCVRLPDGRVGAFLRGSNRPIRDDPMDKSPHGTLDMEHGLVVSCNAYFAQLGAYDVGAEALFDTAGLLGISVGSPDTAKQLARALAQSSYGQGQVVASPFQLARAAAAVANGGLMPQGRWIVDESNDRVGDPKTVLPAESANLLARYMREVVTGGTGRRAAAAAEPIAGKTGTAELANAPSHAWFIGFAPYGPAARRISFAVLIENGRYGGTNAAPAAVEIVNAARELGLFSGADFSPHGTLVPPPAPAGRRPLEVP